MGKIKSYKKLVTTTALKIFLEFLICIFILYLIPLLTVSIDIKLINIEFLNKVTKTVFFNIFSWIYISITFIVIVSLNILKLLKIIKREMNFVYNQSLWLSPQRNNKKLTLKEFVETSNHIDNMQKKIQNMIEEEKKQKEELIFKVSVSLFNSQGSKNSIETISPFCFKNLQYLKHLSKSAVLNSESSVPNASA